MLVGESAVGSAPVVRSNVELAKKWQTSETSPTLVVTS